MRKVNRRRMPNDGKSSHCLWQGELIKKIKCYYLIKTFQEYFKIDLNLIILFCFSRLILGFHFSFYHTQPPISRSHILYLLFYTVYVLGFTCSQDFQIIWLFNLLTFVIMSVPDGYSRVWCTLNLIPYLHFYMHMIVTLHLIYFDK